MCSWRCTLLWECPSANLICPTFGAMAGFEVDASHIFPWVVLAVATLVAHRAGDGGASTTMEEELPLLSEAITALWCVGSDSALLEQSPAAQAAADCSLLCMFFLCLHRALCPRGGVRLDKWGLCMCRGPLHCLCRYLQPRSEFVVESCSGLGHPRLAVMRPQWSQAPLDGWRTSKTSRN